MNFLKAFLFALLAPFALKGAVWTDCSEAFEPIAQNVTLPSPAEIDYKVGLGKEFREALANRPDINWNAVADNYREWSEHTTTLSGPARMLVACVLSVVTQGMGTTEWLAGHGIAEGTATNAALSSGIQTLAASAGTSLAGNLGDIGKTFDELTWGDFVKSLASTMLTAGISQSLSTSLQLPDKPETFPDSLKTNATHGLVRTGVDSAIYGGKVGKNLAQTLTTAAVDAGFAQIAHKIGDGKADGKLNPVTHKAAHGALAVTAAKLTGRDPVGAAIGSVVGETAAEALHKESKNPATTAAQARIIGDTVAFLAGRDVASADSAGKTAVEQNYLMHPETSMKIAMAVQDESLSEEERSQKIDAAIEEGKAQDEIYVATMGFVVAPGITSGYYATQSAAHWAGTYAGGGMQAVKQEFRNHPVASIVDVATTGMLGEGFVKSMTKVPQLVETGQVIYKHHKAVGQLKGNVKQGKLFEEKEFRKSVSEHGGGETQVTVEAQDGTRVRLDYVFKNPKNPENVIINILQKS